jgi:hypothetical protein
MRTRRLARLARVLALCTLALFASVPPGFAQDAQPESAAPSMQRSQATPRSARQRSLLELRERRDALRRQAPPGFEAWMRDMRPVQRRTLERRLHRMAPAQRERFFRDWDRLSLRERRELADRLTLGERRRRELPPRLRTPEMRERLAAMSPDERRDFVARVREWREMKPAERARMRARLETFGALSEAEQQQLVEERFRRRSPEERARILRDLRGASQQMRTLRELREQRRGAGDGHEAPRPEPSTSTAPEADTAAPPQPPPG